MQEKGAARPVATTPTHGNPFALLLRECRKRAGLSQLQLADYLGVGKSRVSKWETGVSDPPQDPQFYERLRKVPGFSEVDITQLREVREADKSSKDYGKLFDEYEQLQAKRQSLDKILESQLFNPAAKNRQDLARVEAANAYEELAMMIARALGNRSKSATLAEDMHAQAIRVLSEWDQQLPEDFQAYCALLSRFNSHWTDLILWEFFQFLKQAPQALPSTGEEEAQAPTPESLPDVGEDASMRVLDSEKGADSARNWMKPEGDPLSHGKEGERQPSSRPEQGQQAPKKGEVYERPRSHYDSEYLQENARHIASILGDALKNDDPALSPDRKQALHVIVESIVKEKGASLNKVSREKHIPHPSLADWVRKGLVPVLYRDKRTIYLANEIAEEVSHDYRDAKEMNYSAARLLRERREKYFPAEAVSQRHRRRERPARNEAEIPVYEVVPTLRRAAEKTGVPLDEIMTSRDIQTEWNVNKGRVNRWTQGGPHGQPHLTPLPVRLGRERGGSQLLFRRSDVERLVADPPKGGRPQKKQELLPSEASEHLMTLAEASKTFGIPVGTLSSYIHEGKVTIRGRQRSPAPGGGKILIEQAALASFLSSRRTRGRPKKNPGTRNNS
jgi:transcriptional regulator with XRE-family HTH domain